MSEPTKAGQEYLAALTADTWSRDGRRAWAQRFVAAIEAEAHAAGLAEGRSEREALRDEAALIREAMLELQYRRGRLSKVTVEDVAMVLAAIRSRLAAHPTPPDSIEDTQRAEEEGR